MTNSLPRPTAGRLMTLRPKATAYVRDAVASLREAALDVDYSTYLSSTADQAMAAINDQLEEVGIETLDCSVAAFADYLINRQNVCVKVVKPLEFCPTQHIEIHRKEMLSLSIDALVEALDYPITQEVLDMLRHDLCYAIGDVEADTFVVLQGYVVVIDLSKLELDALAELEPEVIDQPVEPSDYVAQVALELHEIMKAFEEWGQDRNNFGTFGFRNIALCLLGSYLKKHPELFVWEVAATPTKRPLHKGQYVLYTLDGTPSKRLVLRLDRIISSGFEDHIVDYYKPNTLSVMEVVAPNEHSGSVQPCLAIPFQQNLDASRLHAKLSHEIKARRVLMGDYPDALLDNRRYVKALQDSVLHYCNLATPTALQYTRQPAPEGTNIYFQFFR